MHGNTISSTIDVPFVGGEPGIGCHLKQACRTFLLRINVEEQNGNTNI